MGIEVAKRVKAGLPKVAAPSRDPGRAHGFEPADPGVRPRGAGRAKARGHRASLER